MAAIRKGDDHDIADAAGVDLELVPSSTAATEEEEAAEQRNLLRASMIAKTTTVVLTVALLLLWPIPMVRLLCSSVPHPVLVQKPILTHQYDSMALPTSSQSHSSPDG